MEFNEKKHNTSEKNTTQSTSMPKVSVPIVTQENGFYRYNYEKERLEFINNEKVIAFTIEIPLDQWEDLPSHEDYCKNITEQANEQVRQNRKFSKITPIFILLIVIAPVILIYISAKIAGDSPFIFTLILMVGMAIPIIILVKINSK